MISDQRNFNTEGSLATYLLSGDQLFSVFFRPLPVFWEWLNTLNIRKKRMILDMGCGSGFLVHELIRNGYSALGIDYRATPEMCVGSRIIPSDAERFLFPPDCLPLMSRPCAGPWIRNVLLRAVREVGECLYIGIHPERDLTDLPDTEVREVLKDAGEDGETVYHLVRRGYSNDMATQADDKKSFERVVFVRTKGSTGIGSLGGIRRKNLYWDCGMSYMPWDESTESTYEICHELIPYTSDDQIDDYENLVRYGGKLPEPQPPCARMGWVSPDGEFYPCAYCCHRGLAERLCVKFYGEQGSSIRLEREGWLKIQEYGYRSEDGPWPQPMKDTFTAIVEAFELATDEQIERNLYWNAEHYDKAMGWSVPNADGTIRETLRQCVDLYCRESPLEPKVELIEPGEKMVGRWDVRKPDGD